MLSVTLALGASVAWGSADFLAGITSRRVALLTVLLVTQVAALALLVAVLAVTAPSRPSASSLVLAALAGVFNIVALAALYRGLARGKMGLVTPLAATDSAVPVAFGLITGDRPGAVALAGICVAFVGILLATRGAVGSQAEPAAGGEAPRDSYGKGVAFGLVAAISFGAYMVALDGASDEGTLWAVTASHLSTVAVLAAVALATRSAPALARRDAPALLGVGALELTATFLFATAATEGILSVVGVLSSFYPVVTIILARLVLSERLERRQRLGAAAVLVGAALMAAAV